MKTFFLSSLVALALTVLLSWRGAAITPGVYRFGFFLGLVSFAIWLFSSGEFYIALGPSTWKRAGLVPLVVIGMMTPYILLVEAGVAGYLGFASFLRYISLVISVLGVLGLLLSVVFPRFLRHRHHM